MNAFNNTGIGVQFMSHDLIDLMRTWMKFLDVGSDCLQYQS